MKRYISRIITSLVLVVGLVFFSGVPAFAAPVNVIDGNGDACKGNTNICGNGGTKLFTIIKSVINVLLYAAGIIAVIMIIIGGINYTLSAGDNAKVASAKNTVLYAVVGLIVASLAYAVVNFVVANLF